jgi:hypothetical protein
LVRYISNKGIYKVYDLSNGKFSSIRDIIFNEKKFFTPQQLLTSAKKVSLLLRQDNDDESIVFISCNSSTHILPGQLSHISPPSMSLSISSHPLPHPLPHLLPIIYDEIIIISGPPSSISFKAVTLVTEGNGYPSDEELEKGIYKIWDKKASPTN